jgi:hypothetical protein
MEMINQLQAAQIDRHVLQLYQMTITKVMLEQAHEEDSVGGVEDYYEFCLHLHY